MSDEQLVPHELTDSEILEATTNALRLELIESHRLRLITQAVQDLIYNVDESDTKNQLHNTLGAISDLVSA